MPDFRHDCTVYYEDTDEGGVVYHANYLKYTERSRSEWLKHLGFSHTQLLNDYGVRIVVRRIAVSYRAPARLEDRLEVTTACIKVGKASLKLYHTVEKDGVVLSDMDVDLAIINEQGKPCAMPKLLQERIS